MTTSAIQAMMEEAASPFGANILAEEYIAVFSLPLIRYNGTGDHVDHIKQYHTWMIISCYSPAMMCQAFSFTLTGARYNWFKGLPMGMINSFEELQK